LFSQNQILINNHFAPVELAAHQTLLIVLTLL